MTKILIADDSGFIRLVLKKYLKAQGFEIVGEATSGDEAVKLYKELSPDILILDIIMESSGLDALDEIFEYNPMANVIIYSGSAQPTYVTKAIKIGTKGFLTKAIKENSLCPIINDIISTAKLDESEQKHDNFFLSVTNNSLIDYEINENDILNIKKHIEPEINDLVIAEFNQDMFIGKYEKNDNIITITPGNPKYKTIKSENIEILGVMQNVLKVPQNNTEQVQ